jgi:aminopeptidase N
MLLDHIGEDAFRNGLKRYFSKHAYKNTIRSDLWEELSTTAQTDIKELMTPWLEKPGLPMLSVSAAKGSLKLSQRRFLLDGEDDKSRWPLPLLSDKKLPIDLLKDKEQILKWGEQSPPLFNVTGSGHYIVNYGDKNAKENLKQGIKKQNIDSSGRINAINDMLLLSRKPERSLTDVLDLITRCEGEPRDPVWSMMIRAIGLAGMLTEGDDNCEEQIRRIKRGLSDYWYKKLGWDDRPTDELNTKLLRATILSLKVSGESREAVGKALKKFEQAGNVEELPAEHRAIIASAEVRFGRADSIQKMLDEYSSTPNPEVQHSIAAALCSTKKRKVGQELIDWALAGKGDVRDQDMHRWFVYLCRNRYTRADAWDWMKTDWEKISHTFEKTVDDFIAYAASPISTDPAKKQFVEFFEPKKDIVILKRAILVSLSAIDARLQWRTQEEPKLKKYLKSYK